MSPLAPEQLARREIDAMLAAAGWLVQDRGELNLSAGRGVAVREFPLTTGHGHADYLLFVDSRPVGVLEAKPAGHTLTGVEVQSQKYSTGLPPTLHPPVSPLPFLYQSTGVDTRFTNLLDPDPRSRRVFAVHRPETIAEWLSADPLPASAPQALPLAAERKPGYAAPPSTLRSRLQTMPPLVRGSLYQNQVQAITNLEASLRANRPRALVQMATGSGKTITAVSAVYRLIKHGGARRVLFLVDRTNLGEQAEGAFAGFRSPDDNRLFTELYKVQRLTSNSVFDSTKVVITTIQRLYSMLKGEPDLDPALEEGSGFETADPVLREPLPVVYSAAMPPEYFDVIVVDECHRSIYSLWRQVLEYFDAFLVGLTATPATHTYGFFSSNLVMEYTHEQAVADNVNVDFEVYRIRTKITEQGATVEAGDGVLLGLRNRRTRALRWQAPDEDLTYGAEALDRAVVARDQIRLLVRTFRDRLFTDLFPNRREVPKTLIFAKDDSHAEDIVEIVREEFARGNDFCQKITYKTTGAKPSDLIQEFRNSFNPRVAVTVDMIATGTDIRPIEVVMFLRNVRSRVHFEQMKGRGVRVVDPNELQAVTPDAKAKDHFVIVDCVGLIESGLSDTTPLERARHVSLASLLEHVAMGGSDPDLLSSLASRLSRLAKRCGPEEERRVREASGGARLADVSRAIVDALDPDRQLAEARRRFAVPEGEEPTERQVEQVARSLAADAVQPIATRPKLRELLPVLKAELEQVIDEVSRDELLSAGVSEEARDKARALVQSFERFLAEHREELDALQFFYSQPYTRRLRFADVKALAAAIGAPPRSWTPELLWRAYQTLEHDRVRGASAQRLLTDVVSLVRFALHQQPELVPFPDQVRARFAAWLAQQRTVGRRFTPEQAHWLEMIRDHIATSLEMEVDDFDFAPFAEAGGLGAARRVFGAELTKVLQEMNEVLAA